MEYPKVLKIEPILGACLGCLRETGLQCIFSSCDDNVQLYADMLVNCFNLELFVENSSSKNLYKMCENCVMQLREAFYFKYQIIKAQERLQNRLVDVKVENVDCLIAFEVQSFDDNSLEEDNNFDIVNLPTNKTLRNKTKKIKTKRNNKKYPANAIIDDKDILKKEKSAKLPYVLEKDAVVCDLCNKDFLHHNSLLKHMAIHYPNYICDICAKAFSNKSHLTKHISTHQTKKYKCDICGKLYKGQDCLRSHIRRHSKYKIYKCLHCSERFQHYHKRQKHLIDVHQEKVKEYKCEPCSKFYNSASALSRHVKCVHLQSRPYVCAICGDGFFSKSQLTDHTKKHTGEKEFKCTVCNKCYGRKFTLTEHMRIHNNDRRFICPFCNRSFIQKCTLKGHLKTHEKAETQSD